MGPQYQLFVFLGRLTHQKGGDLIAIAAKAILAASDIVQACPNISILYRASLLVGSVIARVPQKELEREH